MIKANPVYLMAAYGRKYLSKAEVLKAWKEGLDFKIVGGPYCSIRDVDALKNIYNKIFLEYGNANDHAVRVI